MAAYYFEIPFASGGGKTTVPDPTQGDGTVSFNEGWPSRYGLDQATDAQALPVSRRRDNYVHFEITTLLKDLQELGTPTAYNALFNYPLLAYARGTDGNLYRCEIPNGPLSLPVVDPVGDLTGTWGPGGFPGVGHLPGPSVYRQGLLFSRQSNELFTIGVGNASATNGGADLDFTVAFQKDVDVAWTAGNGGGGMPSFFSPPSQPNSTWYRVFLIGKTDGTTDIGLDTSDVAANLLVDATGFTLYRRIGWLFLDQSRNIPPMFQLEDDLTRWYWETAVFFNATPAPNIGSPRSTYTLGSSAPPSSIFVAVLNYRPINGGLRILVTSEEQADIEPNSTNFTVGVTDAVGGGDGRGAEVHGSWEVNADREFFIRASDDAISGNNAQTYFIVEGWIDNATIP